MFNVIWKNEERNTSIIEMDSSLVSILEDWHDSRPESYESLDENITPDEVISFLKNHKNATKSEKIFA